MVNFVILCTDQQRADSLGCAGNREARTPNLDALAARGTRFARHYTPNQICCPSRGTMITGLYPRHHGMTTNGRTLHDGLATLPGVPGRAGGDRSGAEGAERGRDSGPQLRPAAAWVRMVRYRGSAVETSAVPGYRSNGAEERT